MDGPPGSKRLQGMDCLSQLPEDVLWTILGFLDLPSLYTARLVCKRFRKSAAGRFKALDCTTLKELPTTDFTQFSGTTHLAVTVSHQSHIQSLAHPRIAPVITHVSLKGFHFGDGQITEELEAVLMRLPKLRSVSLQPRGTGSGLLLLPASLEELKIPDPPYCDYLCREQWEGVGDASPLTRYSQLTSLAIEMDVGAGTSLGCLSSLRNLRSLDLRGCSSGLGPLSTFITLTSLTFEQRCSGEDGSIFQDLGRLTGLSRLVLSEIWRPRYVQREDLACIAQLTNLTCLDMSGCKLADSAERSPVLAALTCLVSVSFSTLKLMPMTSGYNPYRMPHLSLPQLKALESLSLGNAADVSILGQTTGLTHLGLCFEIERWDTTSLQGLRPAVAGMRSLRSLEVSVTVYRERDDYDYWPEDDWPVVCLDGVLPACTMLTKLVYRGELRPDRDLEVCASVPGLRSLLFEYSSALTAALLPALQAMSGLTELSLRYTGISAADMTPAVIAAFDAERRQLGWPLLKLRVTSCNRGDYERL